MAHGPMQHAQDQKGAWTIFTHLVDGGWEIPLVDLRHMGPNHDQYWFPFTLTKFMVLELIAAGLLIAIFVPLARRAARQAYPTGWFWNAFESLLTFIRDEVARPTLMSGVEHHDHGHAEAHGHGEHHEHGHDLGHTHGPKVRPEEEVDRYVPFLWTLFLFILFCNLLGMLPLMGSPTASIWVTGALAACSFVMMHGAAIAKMGLLPYLKSLWPAMDIPLVIAVFLKPMIFVIELFGTVIKSGVLAVRLFANMFAGHMVLAMILFFIVMTANQAVALWAGITVASVLGVAALSLLELFVAFLQAYIFVFLTALFMGMALHPQH
jgi:F-type H+-transporting ATPase subunit a